MPQSIARLSCCVATCAVVAIALSVRSADRSARPDRPTREDDAASTRPVGATAPAAAADAPSRNAAVSLTIYSTADPATFSPQDLMLEQLTSSNPSATTLAPGYGVVREVRRMDLQRGDNRLEFADVATGIDPTTVAFRSLTAPGTTTVLEQNFEYDLTNVDKLLGKYLGRDVVIVTRQPADRTAGGAPPTPATVRGKLLSYETASSGLVPTYVVQTADGPTPLVIQRGDNIDSIRLADAGKGLVSKPTLNWTVAADQPGPHDVEVTYQTDGLTWRADYNLVISRDEAAADLSAWVTVLNGSGLAYPDARLKLVAGNVQRYESERSRRQAGGSGGLFGSSGAEEKGFEEKGFFEYHLYTLGRATTLPNNSTKQIELFPPRSAVPVGKVFVYYGLSPGERHEALPSPKTDRAFGTTANPQVDVYLKFKNDQASHLGLPLPAGRMRLYKVDEADGNREFVGEDVIQHTPKDESVLLRLGAAFDLVGNRTQTDYADEPHTITEKFEIVLRNHKKEAVTVVVKENLYRWFNWEITESSDKWAKQDARTIHFTVQVPPDGEKKVTYTVKYSW